MSIQPVVLDDDDAEFFAAVEQIGGLASTATASSAASRVKNGVHGHSGDARSIVSTVNAAKLFRNKRRMVEAAIAAKRARLNNFVKMHTFKPEEYTNIILTIFTDSGNNDYFGAGADIVFRIVNNGTVKKFIEDYITQGSLETTYRIGVISPPHSEFPLRIGIYPGYTDKIYRVYHAMHSFAYTLRTLRDYVRMYVTRGGEPLPLYKCIDRERPKYSELIDDSEARAIYSSADYFNKPPMRLEMNVFQDVSDDEMFRAFDYLHRQDQHGLEPQIKRFAQQHGWNSRPDVPETMKLDLRHAKYEPHELRDMNVRVFREKSTQLPTQYHLYSQYTNDDDDGGDEDDEDEHFDSDNDSVDGATEA